MHDELHFRSNFILGFLLSAFAEVLVIIDFWWCVMSFKDISVRGLRSRCIIRTLHIDVTNLAWLILPWIPSTWRDIVLILWDMSIWSAAGGYNILVRDATRWLDVLLQLLLWVWDSTFEWSNRVSDIYRSGPSNFCSTTNLLSERVTWWIIVSLLG